MGFNHQEKEGRHTMNTKTLGIDLAKSVFHLCGMDGQRKVALRKRLSRGKLLEFLANLPPCLIGMEACGSFDQGIEIGAGGSRL